MKQRTHTWLAIRAIALLDDTGAAPGLVKLLLPHVNSVAIGSWIPDLADSRKGGSKIDNHVLKMKPYDGPGKERFIKDKQKTFRELGKARQMTQFIKDWGSGLDDAWWGAAYKANPAPGQHQGDDPAAGSDNVVSTLAAGIGGSLSTPAYYNGHIYWTSGYGNTARELTINSDATMSITSWAVFCGWFSRPMRIP